MLPRFRGTALLLITSTAILTTGCSREAVSAQTPAPQVASVAVAKATIKDLSQGEVLTAEFRPFQEIDVMAKVSGYVRKIDVDIGMRVKQGQLLATLEIPEMAADEARARAAIDRSEAEVAKAHDELQRVQAAHDMAHLSRTRFEDVTKKRPGLIAQQEVDEMSNRDLVSEAQVATAQSNLRAAEQQVLVSRAELAHIMAMLDYTRIVAPFAGVVTKRFADTGSMVQAGTANNALPLIRLSQNNLLRLILPVPEKTVPGVRVGQTVAVRVPSMERSFSGRVVRFTGRLNSATRTMDTEVDVPNPSLLLMPGMFAEVNLTLTKSAEALAVPVLAVDTAESTGASQVARVNADNRIEIVPVRTGLRTANDVEIRSGLHDGDLVVIGSRAALRPGELVRPRLTEIKEQ